MSAPQKGDLGARVRELREVRGWSQAELAAKLPDVKQQSIDQLESGKVARPRFLPELATALNVSTQWLLTGEDAKTVQMEATDVDVGLLRQVIAVVEKEIAEGDLKLSHEDKARFVTGIYELTKLEEDRSNKRLEQVASNIIHYERFLKNQG